MREVEKLDAGMEYCFMDKEVVDRKLRAVIGCRRFAEADPANFAEQEAAIKELFGSTREHVYVQPGFSCDNGKNILWKRIFLRTTE